VVTRDADTDKIAEGVAAEIKAATGKEVYLVIARFDRQFLDANRPPEIAFDSAAARPIHERYHGTIREFVDEIRANHKAGLLIDVHGQHKIADSLVRGTLNGKSVARLIKRAGFDAVTGPKGLFGLLEANGFKVFPTNAHPTKDKNEDGGFNGGHTTSTYGSHHADGIDALQFEYGIEYRRPRELDRTIKRTAKSILAFYHTYLT
jgi:N-formylglutamate amidohydrolase